MNGAATGGGAVDAHQHVWDPGAADYPWLTPDLAVLDRRYGVADVAADLGAAGITRTVLVQAADNVSDTENMFREAAAHPVVDGVVVWLPLHDVDASAALLDSWVDRPVVGVRHLVHREPDPDWLGRADVGRGLALLAARGLAFDVCAETPHLLGQVPALAAAHPDLTLVVDHLGKPPIAAGGWQPWAGLLERAAAAPNVVAKLSGLNTAAGARAGTAAYRPYVDHALAVFGPDRLMYGGDWPFALLAADGYPRIHADLVATLSGLTPAERRAVQGGTARRVYRLPP